MQAHGNRSGRLVGAWEDHVSPCTTSEEAARRSANSTRRPRLLLFYHVAKTGGTSVALALARRALAGRLDLFVPMQLARCWLYHAHGTLLDVRLDATHGLPATV